MRFKSRSRALAASALAASLGLAGLGLVAPAAQASEPTEATRIEGLPTYEGGTRYETAAEAATTAYPDGAANVVLASGEKFPDALAGGGLAGQLDAPILLTLQGELPESTIEALAALDPTTVTILGESDAVSDAVEAELVALGYTVDRIGGADRFETAALIAAELDGDTAVLANGLKFPDALAISPGAHELELPLLLTTADTLQADAAAALADDAIENVVIVGETEVVSQAIEDQLEADGKTVTRLGGDTRYETAIEIAEFHLTVGFTLDEVVLARGDKFPDALAGGPLAASMMAPMVLTQSDVLTPVTGTWLSSNCQEIDALTIMGGPVAIADAVVAAAQAAAQCDANIAFASTPAGAQENSTSTDNTTNEGAETFTFTGVTGTNLAVALFPCENITASGGNISFADAEASGVGSSEADDIGTSSTGEAVIEQINGAAPDAATEDYTVSAVNGVVTVVVDSEEFDCATVVLFNDTDDDGELDLNASNLPTEPFGLGGPVSFIYPEAPTGTYPSGTLLFFDTGRNLLVLSDGFSYFYDSNDLYYYDHDQNLTEAEFESYLSIGDTIDDENNAYSRTDGAISDFNIHDNTANAPTNVAAAAGDFDLAPGDTAANDIRVTFTPSTGGLIEDYTAYLYVDDNNAATACADGTPVDINGAAAGTDNFVTGAASPLVFTNQADGTYCVVVDADTESGGSSPLSAPAVVTVDVVPNDTTAPQSVDARIIDDILVGATAGNTDTWKIVFNEDMDAPAAGDVIRVQDADGTLADVVCGTNATCTLNVAAESVGGVLYEDLRVLTVELTGAPTVVTGAAGTIAGLQYPATVVDSSGITDLSMNAWNEAGSADRIIDEEA